MMTHDEIKLRLQDYLENLLPDSEKGEIYLHLSSCAGCQKELAELQDLFSRLNTLSELEPPEDLRELIMSRVTAESNIVSTWDMIRNWLPKLGYAYIAGLAIVLGLGYRVYLKHQPTHVSLSTIIESFTGLVVSLSKGIANVCQWGEGLWIVANSLIRHNLTTLSTSLIIESIIILAGIMYWYLRKQKTIYLIFA